MLPTTSTLPVSDATDFGMGYSQSEFSLIFVNVLVRPTRYPRVFRRASQGPPQGRVVPFGGARQGPDRLRIVGYVLLCS